MSQNRSALQLTDAKFLMLHAESPAFMDLLLPLNFLWSLVWNMGAAERCSNVDSHIIPPPSM